MKFSVHTRATAAVIAEELRAKITRGDLKDGMPLRQDRIAEQFGVSHIPVREALKQLAAEGLCDLIHNRGFVVAGLSVDAVREFTEFRRLVEGQMTRWSVPLLLDDDIRKAEAILDELDRCNDVQTVLDLNAAFHNVIYECARRPFIMSTIQKVRANIGRYWRLAWEELGHKARSQDEHRAILELCKQRKAEQAAISIENQILSTGSLIVSYLERERNKRAPAA